MHRDLGGWVDKQNVKHVHFEINSIGDKIKKILYLIFVIKFIIYLNHQCFNKQAQFKAITICMYSNIALFILLTLLSCKGNKIDLPAEQKEQRKTEKDILDPGAYFAKKILKSNVGMISFNSTDLESLNYNQLFSEKGLSHIAAYYDKTANIINQPTEIQDFFLFVVSYDNEINAEIAFERIKADAALNNASEETYIDQITRNRIQLLELGNNYAGLITYNKNQVFSLVENCQKVPSGRTWLEWEYIFTDLLKNENGFVEVLKAGCEEGRYYGGRRKANGFQAQKQLK